MVHCAVLKGFLSLFLAFCSVLANAQQVQSLCGSNRVLAMRSQETAAGQVKSCEATETQLLAQVLDTLARGGILLLGEVHDNVHHHVLRARIIDLLAAKRIRTALVFEHVPLPQQPQLSAVVGRTSAALFDALEWEKSGWPDRHVVAPLMDAATASAFALVAGSPSREEVRSASRQPVASDAELPRALREELLEELENSHCGLVGKGALEPMLRVQLARDRRMAEQLMAAQKIYGSAVLLAGNGHVRSDRGVPFQLKKRLTVPVLSIAFEEQGLHKSLATPADWTIVTPEIAREDPCAQMRKQALPR